MMCAAHQVSAESGVCLLLASIAQPVDEVDGLQGQLVHYRSTLAPCPLHLQTSGCRAPGSAAPS